MFVSLDYVKKICTLSLEESSLIVRAGAQRPPKAEEHRCHEGKREASSPQLSTWGGIGGVADSSMGQCPLSSASPANGGARNN